MSDLTAKFGGLEEQLAAQHLELMQALSTIAYALGTPPAEPTTTLADISTLLGALIDGVALIYDANTTYHTNVLGTLALINANTDLLITNESLNAQRLLAMLLATSCPCDATVPLLPGELGETPTDYTPTELCQRVQYFVDLYAAWVVNSAVYIQSSSMSSFAVNNLMQLGLDERSIATGQLHAGIPTSTRDAIASNINSAVGAVGSTAVNAGMFDAATDSALLEALRTALYGEDNAASASGAAADAINGMGYPSWLSDILTSMFYSAWPNDIYSAVPIVDASDYDGTVCAPEGADPCITLFSQVANIGGTILPCIVWPTDRFTSANNDGGGTSADLAIWCTSNLVGYTLTPTVNVSFYPGTGGHMDINAGNTQVLPITTHAACLHPVNGVTFSIELCEPSGV